MKYLVILVATAGLLGAGAAYVFRGDPGEGESGETSLAATSVELETYRVERRNLRVTIVETGQLKAKESVPVHSPHENSHATIAFIADEGTVVEEGDEVLRFDPDEMEKRVEQLEPEQIEHEASLKSAQADLEIKQSTTQLDLDKAQLDFETAEKELTKALEGTLVLQEREATEAVRQTAYDVEQATQNLKDSEELEKENFLTPEEVEKARAALDRAVSAHESAKLKLRIFQEFTRPMEIRTRENTLSSARQQLENARKKRESTLASAEASLSRAQRRLERTKERLEEAREDLEKMVVKSPGSGIIIYGDPDQPWFEAKPKVGDKVWPHQTILTLPVLKTMQARFDIHESDIARVKVGQTATITLEVDPDLRLTGTLTKIGSLATGRGNDPNVRKFDCEVTIDQENIGHKPGISARVELLIEELEDVLVIPVQAVHLKEGKHLVYVTGGEEAQAREVVLGASTSSLVEVKEGLTEGEHILLGIIGCLDRPTGGHYALQGQDVSRLDDRTLSTIRNEHIGFVFQSYHLIPSLTALENVELPLFYRGWPARQRRQQALAALERLGLSDRTHHLPEELSGGQKQRVAIARALSGDPSLVLADEPTGNLDSATGAETLELLLTISEQGTTVLIVTHDANIAARTPRQIQMRDGRIVDGDEEEVT